MSPPNGRFPWLQPVMSLGVASILGFLVLFLLGALPFLPSPIGRLQSGVEAVQKSVLDHETTTRELLRVQRLSCRGVWRGQPEVQDQC